MFTFFKLYFECNNAVVIKTAHNSKKGLSKTLEYFKYNNENLIMNKRKQNKQCEHWATVIIIKKKSMHGIYRFKF